MSPCTTLTWLGDSQPEAFGMWRLGAVFVPALCSAGELDQRRDRSVVPSPPGGGRRRKQIFS